MAWLAVNKDGTETVSPQKPIRDFWEWSYLEEIWVESECGSAEITIMLPKGSIYKLIGKELTWSDEPVELG